MNNHQILRSFALGLIMSLVFLLCVPGPAQVNSTWFDINPSKSNLDPASPNGGTGGRVNRLGATSDLSRIYATSEWGGLYQSFNQGLTWVRVNTFAPSATWDVKVDPGNNNQVYVTSFYDGRVNSRAGISISSDGGQSWRNAPLPPTAFACANANRRTQPSAWQIAINPNNPRTVFVGSSCGLARSLDRGATWTYIDPSPGDNAEQIYAVVAHDRQTVDVIGDNGHFRSADNGNTWTPVPAVGNPGPTSANSGFQSSLAVSPAENYVLFASTPVNIWESDDGGNTWPTSLTLPLRSGGNSNVQGRIPFIKTNQRITSNQFDVWFGDIDLFKTIATTPSTATPGGTPRAPLNAWTNVQSGAHNDVGDVMFDPRFSSDACPVCFSNDGGIYRNTRGNAPLCHIPAWEQPEITPHGTWIWGFNGRQLSGSDHALYYGLQDAGGFATTTARENFGAPVPGWNNYSCCDISENETQSNYLLSLEGFFSPGRAFRLFRRDADGSDRQEISNYPSTGTFGSFKSGRELVRFGNNAYAAALSDGVYITNNITSSPISWTALNAPTALNSNVGGLKVASVDGTTNFFYYTGTGNPDGATGQVFRFSGTSPGSTWTQLPLPTNINSVSVYDVDPNDGDRLIISGINAVTNTFSMWKTEDFGTNWISLADLDSLMVGNGAYRNRANLGPTAFTAFNGYWQPFMVQYNPREPTTIVAGAADAGIFLSLDDGDNWQGISNPLEPNSQAPHIPRPLFAYFSPGRFSASTTSFDVWIATRGAGVVKVVIDGFESEDR